MKIKDFFRTKYDVCIPNELLRLIYAVSEKLTKSEVLVLLDVLQRGGMNHGTPISIAQLAADCRISERSATGALKHLRGRGLIQYEHTSGDQAPALIALNFVRKPFTQVPAAAYSAAMETKLSFTALRIMAFIWRQTYGYKGKNGIAKQISTFSDSYIKKGTGIDRKNAYRALRELQAVGAITIGLTVGYYRGTGHDIKEITVNDVWKQAAPPAVRIAYGTAVRIAYDTAVRIAYGENELETVENVKNVENTVETPPSETFVHMQNLPHKKEIKNLSKECVNKDGLNARLRSQPQKILAMFPNEEVNTDDEANVLYICKETESDKPETECNKIIDQVEEEPERITITAEAEAEKKKADEEAAKKYQDSLTELLNSLTDDEQNDFEELTKKITLTPAEQLEEISRKTSRIKAANCQKSMKQRII